MLSPSRLAPCLIAILLLASPIALGQEAPPADAPAVMTPAPVEKQSVSDAIAKAITEVGNSFSSQIGEEVDHAGDYVREVALQLGLILAVALAAALAIGMIVGSVLSALILHGTIKRLSVPTSTEAPTRP